MYLPDASLMPPNAVTVHGRDGIQKFWGAFADAYRIKLTLTAEEVEGRGDLAYSRGGYTLDLTPKAKGPAPVHDEGKFLVIYRGSRTASGGWRSTCTAPTCRSPNREFHPRGTGYILLVPQVRRAPAREPRQDLAGSSAKRCPVSLRGA
jgi:ketosteroid isomerase-like protein